MPKLSPYGRYYWSRLAAVHHRKMLIEEVLKLVMHLTRGSLQLGCRLMMENVFWKINATILKEVNNSQAFVPFEGS